MSAMKSKRINGRQSRPCVQRCEAFKNSNGQLYAEWRGGEGMGDPNKRYVVYSYGPHWPLFIYVPQVDTWFENKGKYGPTTSKHRTFTHPHCDTVPLTVDQMKLLDRAGYIELVRGRINGNANG